MTGYTRFCHGSNWLMRLIQWRTGSTWGHVEHVLRDGSTIRAWFPGGVQRLLPGQTPAWTAEWHVRVPAMTPAQEDAQEAFLLAQVGKPYDWFALIGLFFGQNWSRKSAWFCSRLEDASYNAATTPVAGTIPSARITPGRLAAEPGWEVVNG